MTPERAAYILAHPIYDGLRYAFVGKHGASHAQFTHPDGITEQECEYIMACWRKLPGTASFYSTICEIAHGRIAA